MVMQQRVGGVVIGIEAGRPTKEKPTSKRSVTSYATAREEIKLTLKVIFLSPARITPVVFVMAP
jgi:hypothetical protein